MQAAYSTNHDQWIRVPGALRTFVATALVIQGDGARHQGPHNPVSKVFKKASLLIGTQLRSQADFHPNTDEGSSVSSMTLTSALAPVSVLVGALALINCWWRQIRHRAQPTPTIFSVVRSVVAASTARVRAAPHGPDLASYI